MKLTAALGATGSIGGNTLDVLKFAKDDFLPVLFSANNDFEGLRKAILPFAENPAFLRQEVFICLRDEAAGDKARMAGAFDFLPRARIFTGKNGLLEAIKNCGAQIAVNGISGSAGLEPSLAVLENGIDLALANKESVVMGWNLLQKAAQKGKNAQILPVDSEHSAVFSLLNAHCRQKSNLKEIILTASGGPFKDFSAEDLKKVKLQDALRHPTWKMGGKITVDSASLANKGLEVIEAAYLFNVPPAQIKVVIQRQSIVHSLVRLKNGALYAELSLPDMRLPIYKALTYPQICENPFANLEFKDFSPAAPLNLEFCPPDFERFPMLALAFKAAEYGGAYPIAFNAADEVLVNAFMAGKIGFTDIPALCARVLERDWSDAPRTLEEVMAADTQARSEIKKTAA